VRNPTGRRIRRGRVIRARYQQSVGGGPISAAGIDNLQKPEFDKVRTRPPDMRI